MRPVRESNRIMKTYSAKNGEVPSEWFEVDATDKPLGRLATEIVRRLCGKHKPQFTPHVITGDHIIVINAEKVAVTGNKRAGKLYHRHSGYPGGLKTMSFEQMIEKHPERVIELAVKNMLPKNPLGRQMLRNLKVFAGDKHTHQAQNPTPLKI